MNAEQAENSAQQQIVDQLAAEIRAMAPGARIPTQMQLADRFQVARSTVQTALRELQDQGLLNSVQGKGTFVAGRRPKVTDGQPSQWVLGVELAEVLRQPQVTIDYYGFSAETLSRELVHHLYQLRNGGGPLPETLRIRLIVPDPSARLLFPSVVGDLEDPRPRQRHAAIVAQQHESISTALQSLLAAGAVREARLEVRTPPATAPMKLYVFNDTAAWHGLYRVEKRVQAMLDGTSVEMWDALGMDTSLQSYPADLATEWFETLWSGLAADFTLAP